MDPTLQFVCFLVALILFAIAAVLRGQARALDSFLMSVGFCFWMLVLVVNISKVM